jgi:hypothetical protein
MIGFLPDICGMVKLLISDHPGHRLETWDIEDWIAAHHGMGRSQVFFFIRKNPPGIPLVQHCSRFPSGYGYSPVRVFCRCSSSISNRTFRFIANPIFEYIHTLICKIFTNRRSIVVLSMFEYPDVQISKS